MKPITISFERGKKMKNNKNKPTMLLEKSQKDRLRRMAGLIPLNENLYGNLKEADDEEPDGDEMAPDVGSDLDSPDVDPGSPMDDGMGLDSAPAPSPDLGMGGESNPMVQKLLDLLRPALEQAVAGGQLSISDDDVGGSDEVPPVDMGVEDDLGGGGLSDEVPPGPDGMPGDDDPLREAVPLPSPVGMKEKYQSLEEKIFESVKRQLRKEGLLKPSGKTVPTPKKK